MEKERELFHKILAELDKGHALDDIILIGGWCPLVYGEYFHSHSEEIPFKKTTDLDLLVRNPPRIKKEFDVSAMLNKMGYKMKISPTTGYCKYTHPDLDVEFLTPEKGRGREKPYNIKQLGLNAVGLRYLTLLESNTLKASYKGIFLNVPEPAAYVLHKFIISARRTNPLKQQKDISTATDVGAYLLRRPEQRTKIIQIYSGLPNKWKQEIAKNLKSNFSEMYDFIHEQKK